LGFYRVADRFGVMPVTEIGLVFQRVTFPAYSKLQDDILRLRRYYLYSFQLTGFLSIPLAAGIFLLAPELTLLVFGDQWMPMVPAMRVLVISGCLFAFTSELNSLFQAVGRPYLVTRLHFARLVLLLSLIYPLTLYWGILGTASAVAISAVLTLPVGLYIAMKVTQARAVDFIKAMSPPLASTALMLLVVTSVKSALAPGMGVLEFMYVVVLGLLTYLGVAYVVDHRFGYGLGPLLFRLAMGRN